MTPAEIYEAVRLARDVLGRFYRHDVENAAHVGAKEPQR